MRKANRLALQKLTSEVFWGNASSKLMLELERHESEFPIPEAKYYLRWRNMGYLAEDKFPNDTTSCKCRACKCKLIIPSRKTIGSECFVCVSPLPVFMRWLFCKLS
eukprot:3103842-Amphidinium_carterae.1